ncbi:MAG: PAS domain S-box protein [Leptolyngbyaceae bacterium]|nr:PAS domain S-box protein [Leptolyngbyaceae bacterium]
MSLNSSKTNYFWIVGIGVSASGREALEEFLSHLPATTNAAFVIVHSPSPDGTQLQEESLQNYSQFPIHIIEDGMEVISRQVFIAPPQALVSIEQGCFRISGSPDSIPHRLDIFFESVVEEWGDRTIGIALAGVETDGIRGLEVISNAGGIALAQSPYTTEFTSIAEPAVDGRVDGRIDDRIDDRVVDEILSPHDLATTISDIIQLSFSPSDPTRTRSFTPDPEDLQRILDILAEGEQVNFACYKINTLSRRIAHRITVTHCASIADYIEHLRQSETERRKLRDDVLISVTSFFRDAPAWEILSNQILPQLIDDVEPGHQLRIWVAACATGEEAYSMAIAVDEAIAASGKSIGAKIFATDIDTHALDVASTGIYSEEIADHVSAERLARYFTHHTDTYQVKRSLREMLVLAPHDLTYHSGFSRMHLVVCRNVLIYMQPVLQNQVLRLLHFSLLPEKGVLFLGNAETLGEFSSEFNPIDFRWKLFQKRQDTPLAPLGSASRPILPLPQMGQTLEARPNLFGQVLEQVFQTCLADRRVTCILASQTYQLLHVFYNTAQVLEFPVGFAQMDVTRIVPPNLRLPLTTALNRVKRDRQPVMFTGISMQSDKADRESSTQQESTLTLQVDLYSTRSGKDDYFIIFIERLFQQRSPQPEPSSNLTALLSTFEMSTEAAQQITELEYELQQTRESLQVAIEELETINEEQQATNEELLASNEELQSTNEELQSANEELHSVNTEYQRKIQELTDLTNDIDNLLRSTNIGVIFLDAQLQLRRFTPLASQIVNIRLGDINRPLFHYTHNLDCSDLIGLIRQVLETTTAQEHEVTLTTTGDRLLMSINPYFKQDSLKQDSLRQTNPCEGIVITFVGINDLKRAQDALERRTNELETLYRTVPVGVGVVDSEFRIIRANPVLANLDGYESLEDYEGQLIRDVLPSLANRIIPLYQQVFDTQEPLLNVEHVLPKSDRLDDEKTRLVSYHPLELLNGEQAVSVTVVDITSVKRTEQQLQRNRDLREAIFQESTDAIFLVDAETRISFDCNSRAVELFEADDKQELLNVEGNQFQKEPFTEEEVMQIQIEINEQGFWQREVEYVTCKGNSFWGNIAAKQISAAGQAINLVRVTDITARKQAERILADYNRVLERRVEERTEALQNSLTSFRRALEAAKMVCWERDLATGNIWAYGRHVGNGWVPEEWHLVAEDAPIHPEDLERVTEAVNGAIARCGSFEVEHRVIFPDHPPVWLLAKGTVLTDEAGHPNRIFGMTFNIQERKELELAREASEMRFRNVAENIPGAVFEYILHPDGSDQVIYMSQGCYELWEVEAAEVQESAQALWDMVHPDDRQASYESVRESARTLLPWLCEWRIITPSGKTKWLQGAGRPRRLDNGDLIWNSVILDVSDRHQAEESLRKLTAHLERAQQIAHLGSWERDLPTDTLMWSWETFNIFGVSPDTPVTYDTFMRHVHPEDIERLRQAQEAAIAGASPMDIEYRIIRPDGEVRTVHEQGECIFDENENLRQLAGTVLDITERKANELALQTNEQFLRSIYDYSNVGIFVVDVLEESDFQFVRLNPTHERLTGLTTEYMQGKTPEEVVSPEIAAAIRQNYQRCVDAGHVIAYEEFVPFQGHDYWWLTTLSPLRDESGRIYRLIGTCSNITSKKQAELALQVSEARFRAVFEHAAVGVVLVFPPDFSQLTFANPAFQHMLGYSQAELAELTYADITHPEDRDAEEQLVTACMEAYQDSYQLEKRYVCKDGSIIWVNVIITLIRNEQGEEQLGVAIVENITERRQALDLERTHNRELKEAIFEESNDALFLVDGETGLTIECNQRAVDLFEVDTKDELLNVSGTIFQKYPFTEYELNQIRSVVDQGIPWSTELEYVTKKGNEFWGRISAKTLSVGRQKKRFVQVTDISDRKQVELDMRRNMEELQRLNRVKDDFLSTVSHELRTPLTSIDMAGRMLKLALENEQFISDTSDPQTNKIARYLGILRDQTKQEEDLINDLLDLQRLNADAYSLELTTIDLNTWLPTVTRGIDERATQNNQNFEAILADTVSSMRTDVSVLTRILSELLNNACKYTPANEQIQLTVGTIQKAIAPSNATLDNFADDSDAADSDRDESVYTDFIEFQILNTGVEIPEDEQSLIFEPFYRAVKGDRWSKRGTGLGLTLVKKFIDRLNGSITVESGNNQTCFTIQFPLHIAEE